MLFALGPVAEKVLETGPPLVPGFGVPVTVPLTVMDDSDRHCADASGRAEANRSADTRFFAQVDVRVRAMPRWKRMVLNI